MLSRHFLPEWMNKKIDRRNIEERERKFLSPKLHIPSEYKSFIRRVPTKRKRVEKH